MPPEEAPGPLPIPPQISTAP